MNATLLTPGFRKGKADEPLPLLKPKNYYPNLDSIRGIAITMVVIFHAFSFSPDTHLLPNINRFLTILSQGVPLFFVLSGYLIASIVFGNPERFRWQSYLVRRAAKIMPPFLLSLAFVCIREMHQGHGHGLWAIALGNLLTLPNFCFACPTLNPVTWSLFVEIHFYLALPLLYFALRRANWRHPEYWCVGIFFSVATVFRAASWFMEAGSPGERFHLIARFPNCLDYFAWGMLFAGLSHQTAGNIVSVRTSGRLARGGLLGLVVFVAVCMAELAFFKTSSIHDYAFTSESCRFLICIVAFLMLFGAQAGSGVRVMESRVLQYVGLISYEWFLFHVTIIPWLRYQVGVHLGIPYSLQSIHDIPAFLMTTMVGVIASFVAAALIYHCFSQPLLRKLRR